MERKMGSANTIYGWAGKILKIDLSNGEVIEESLNDDLNIQRLVRWV